MTTEIHPKYRPDIDGLRALAILIVVFFHAFPRIMTGGFIGVDIFFVISGYLISTIIFREMDRGIFSIRHFYARRVNRIFPAFILVLGTCLLSGWFFLFPEELKSLGKHGFNAGLFVLNIVLFQENGYFETSSELKPLLHFWSLCVEEQYYLVWPLMVALFWRTRFHLSMIVLSIITSFALNIFYTHHNPEMAFYFSIPRCWELLAGSLLAYGTIYKGNIVPGKQQNIAALVAVIFIAIALCLLDNTKSFPGFWALLPVTGATLLIASPNSWINRKILSHKIAVFIGLISYPLYLWHWPLLAFAKIGSGYSDLPTNMILGIVTSSFLLAMATYYALEKPLRNRRGTRKTACLLAGWVILIIISLLTYKQVIVPRLATDKASAEILSAKKDWHHPMDANHMRQDNFEIFRLNAGRKEEVVFLGDSHAEQYWARMQELVGKNPDNKPTITFITSSGCLPLPNVNRIERGFGCDKLYTLGYNYSQNKKVKAVVLAAYWEKYFGLAFQSDESFSSMNSRRQPLKWDSIPAQHSFEDFRRDVAAWRLSGKQVYLVLSNPTSPQFDPVNLVSRLGKTMRPFVDKKDWLSHTAPVRAKLIELAAQTGAILIDPADFLCESNICNPLKDGEPIYMDGDHLRDSFSRKHAGFIDRVLE